jgi:S-adenosylmethionine decarboxylase
MHLIIDGFGGNVEKMWDQDLVHRFLIEYPSALGMTRITEPRVLEYNGPHPGDAGVSGFVIIAESHISIHTFPRKNYVNIDIFSCRAFDHDRALEDAKKLFELEDVQTWLLDRGLEWLDERQGLAESQAQRAALEGELEAERPGLRRG